MLTEDGKLYYLTKYKVTLDAQGAGTKAIIFEAAFIAVPDSKVVGNKADSGSYTAASVTKTGCTITITSSDLVSQDTEIYLFTMEKL